MKKSDLQETDLTGLAQVRSWRVADHVECAGADTGPPYDDDAEGVRCGAWTRGTIGRL
jgi:hypothetical protein